METFPKLKNFLMVLGLISTVGSDSYINTAIPVDSVPTKTIQDNTAEIVRLSNGISLSPESIFSYSTKKEFLAQWYLNLLNTNEINSRNSIEISIYDGEQTHKYSNSRKVLSQQIQFGQVDRLDKELLDMIDIINQNSDENLTLSIIERTPEFEISDGFKELMSTEPENFAQTQVGLNPLENLIVFTRLTSFQPSKETQELQDIYNSTEFNQTIGCELNYTIYPNRINTTSNSYSIICTFEPSLYSFEDFVMPIIWIDNNFRMDEIRINQFTVYPASDTYARGILGNFFQLDIF